MAWVEECGRGWAHVTAVVVECVLPGCSCPVGCPSGVVPSLAVSPTTWRLSLALSLCLHSSPRVTTIGGVSRRRVVADVVPGGAEDPPECVTRCLVHGARSLISR